MQRLVEMGAFVLASAWFSDRRYRKCVSLAEETRKRADANLDRSTPAICGQPHFSGFEAAVYGPSSHPLLRKSGAIFRPLKSPVLNRWIKRTRERFGLRLLSRKGGFREALALLQQNGNICVFFDQNAGEAGALTTFFGRVASTTFVAGLLAQKANAEVYVYYSRRRGFWKADLVAEFIDTARDPDSVTFSLNQWLENAMKGSDALCADWLWAHDRWKTQDVPEKRLRLEQKRNRLAKECQFRNWEALPKRTRIWIRLPNWLGDVVMCIPLIRALRQSRPDAEITLLAPAPLVAWLRTLELAEEVLNVPPKGLRYFHRFWNFRTRFPDTYILFTHSIRGDLAAWLTRTPQRFGMRCGGIPRPLLTHVWRPSEERSLGSHHQLLAWENFLKHFGLSTPLDFSPLRSCAQRMPSPNTIGLICGTENTPEKRWPISCWRKLIEGLHRRWPWLHIRLFGTVKDRYVTRRVAEEFPESMVSNEAGRTDLTHFFRALGKCCLVISNDTGGMHLANAAATPLVALFGPTNPVRTGPIFEAPKRIIQPPSCARSSGGKMADIHPDSVIEAAAAMLPPEHQIPKT